MAHYVPPKQSKVSQLIDVIVLVALTVGALFVPLWLGMAGSSKTVGSPVEAPTWEALGQNAVQAAQYEALGYTPETAHDLILARFDYSFTISSLLVMIAVIVAYYFLMLKFSESEYREVISEKLATGKGGIMETWNYIEYAAWGLSALLGLHMLVDWLKTDSTYSEEVLTSSREGELEAMTEEHKH